MMGKWNDCLVANNISPNGLTKNSIICSCHFDSVCFINYKSRRLLTPNAVPCCTISRVKSVGYTCSFIVNKYLLSKINLFLIFDFYKF